MSLGHQVSQDAASGTGTWHKGPTIAQASGFRPWQVSIMRVSWK